MINVLFHLSHRMIYYLVWSPHSLASIRIVDDHTQANRPNPVYGALWAPHSPTLVLSVSSDGCARVIDTAAPNSVMMNMEHPAGQEVLCGDWDKYDPNLVVTGCAGKAIFAWDIRNPSQPMSTLLGHGYAVRRLQCSPHRCRVLASASYDMTVRLWDLNAAATIVDGAGEGLGIGRGSRDGVKHGLAGGGSVFGIFSDHTEFVCGLSFSLFSPRLLASCSWDRRVCLWRHP
ncbi:unnamed protein product [Discosporangium mesarthrocarpum]